MCSLNFPPLHPKNVSLSLLLTFFYHISQNNNVPPLHFTVLSQYILFYILFPFLSFGSFKTSITCFKINIRERKKGLSIWKLNVESFFLLQTIVSSLFTEPEMKICMIIIIDARDFEYITISIDIIFTNIVYKTRCKKIL